MILIIKNVDLFISVNMMANFYDINEPFSIWILFSIPQYSGLLPKKLQAHKLKIKSSANIMSLSKIYRFPFPKFNKKPNFPIF
jgi:hypothetical protein